MSTAILVAQVIAILIQACLLMVSILLLAGLIRSNTSILEAESARIDADLAQEETRAAAQAAQGTTKDPWQGRWPPWDTPGSENTNN